MSTELTGDALNREIGRIRTNAIHQHPHIKPHLEKVGSLLRLPQMDAQLEAAINHFGWHPDIKDYPQDQEYFKNSVWADSKREIAETLFSKHNYEAEAYWAKKDPSELRSVFEHWLNPEKLESTKYAQYPGADAHFQSNYSKLHDGLWKATEQAEREIPDTLHKSPRLLKGLLKQPHVSEEDKALIRKFAAEHHISLKPTLLERATFSFNKLRGKGTKTLIAEPIATAQPASIIEAPIEEKPAPKEFVFEPAVELSASIPETTPLASTLPPPSLAPEAPTPPPAPTVPKAMDEAVEFQTLKSKADVAIARGLHQNPKLHEKIDAIEAFRKKSGEALETDTKLQADLRNLEGERREIYHQLRQELPGSVNDLTVENLKMLKEKGGLSAEDIGHLDAFTAKLPEFHSANVVTEAASVAKTVAEPAKKEISQLVQSLKTTAEEKENAPHAPAETAASPAAVETPVPHTATAPAAENALETTGETLLKKEAKLFAEASEGWVKKHGLKATGIAAAIGLAGWAAAELTKSDTPPTGPKR